jgi:hypothetical protein
MLDISSNVSYDKVITVIVLIKSPEQDYSERHSAYVMCQDLQGFKSAYLRRPYDNTIISNQVNEITPIGTLFTFNLGSLQLIQYA